MPIVLRGVGRFGLCLLAALLIAAAWPETRTRAQQEPAPVRGVVLDDRTGVPIRRAAIAILRDDAAEQEYAADERGAFTIAAPSFPFTLLVSKAGFAPARISELSGDPLQIRMLPGAVIDGRVEDEFGEPVARMIVRATLVSGAGELRESMQYIDETDDRGEFRIGSLPEGRYGVWVDTADFDGQTFSFSGGVNQAAALRPSEDVPRRLAIVFRTAHSGANDSAPVSAAGYPAEREAQQHADCRFWYGLHGFGFDGTAQGVEREFRILRQVHRE